MTPGTGAHRRSVPRLALAAVALSLLRCGGTEPAAPSEVEPPPDLERLDSAVREQYEELRRPLLDGSPDGDAERGEAWGALGRWYDVYDYPDSAARCYENARRLSPDAARWTYHLGTLAERAGELERARSLHTEAARLAPDAPEPRVALAGLALGRGELDRAGELYGQVLAADAANLPALLGSARVALERGDAVAAVERLERLLRLRPEAASARYLLGLAWRRLGDEDRATRELAQVPEQHLDFAGTGPAGPWDRELFAQDRGAQRLTRSGFQAFRQGDFRRAAVLLGAAVAADPEGAEKRINYARALRQLGRLAEAREQLDHALALAQPGSGYVVAARVERGRLLVAGRRPADAAAEFEAALEADPDSAPARAELGRLRHRQGRLPEALRHYRALRDGATDVEGAAFWHAALLVALGRRREAEAALGEDLERLGGDRALRLLQARLLATRPGGGDPERARALIAAAGGPPDVLSAETRAMLAAAERRSAVAVAWQRAAVDAHAASDAYVPAHVARRRLVLYERGDACRQPWEAEERLVTLPVEAPEPEA